MYDTPTLELGDDFTLVPAHKNILAPLIDAYYEDEASARSALPWLQADGDIRRQLSGMLHDVEMQSLTDQIHFWSIQHRTTNEFAGLVGLGDELQSPTSNFSLGYWVRPQFRQQRLALRSASAIFDWLSTRTHPVVVEIVVHPHNSAGLATASRIVSTWGGERLDQFIGIEFNGRTVPHHIYIINLD